MLARNPPFLSQRSFERQKKKKQLRPDYFINQQYCNISVWRHTLVTRQKLKKLSAGIIWHRETGGEEGKDECGTAMWAEDTSVPGASGIPRKKKKKKETGFLMHGYQEPTSPTHQPIPDLLHVNWI